MMLPALVYYHSCFTTTTDSFFRSEAKWEHEASHVVGSAAASSCRPRGLSQESTVDSSEQRGGSNIASHHHRDGSTTSRTLATQFLVLNLDMYAGSLLVSMNLLVQAAVALSQHGSSERAQATDRIYRQQLAAALLLLTTSIVSLWMVYRRRFLLRSRSSTKIVEQRTTADFNATRDARKAPSSPESSVLRCVGSNRSRATRTVVFKSEEARKSSTTSCMIGSYCWADEKS